MPPQPCFDHNARRATLHVGRSRRSGYDTAKTLDATVPPVETSTRLMVWLPVGSGAPAPPLAVSSTVKILLRESFARDSSSGAQHNDVGRRSIATHTAGGVPAGDAARG